MLSVHGDPASDAWLAGLTKRFTYDTMGHRNKKGFPCSLLVASPAVSFVARSVAFRPRSVFPRMCRRPGLRRIGPILPALGSGSPLPRPGGAGSRCGKACGGPTEGALRRLFLPLRVRVEGLH